MKRIVTLLLMISTMLIMTSNVYAGEFGGSGTDKNGNPSWRYFDETGMVKNKWVQNHEGSWYYCGEDGFLLKSTWLHDLSDGKYYYLGDDWIMLRDTKTPDGYTVGSDGAWIKDGQVVVETVVNN
jgi:hypothetical protein